MIISRLIVVDEPLLNALTGHIQCNVNDPILTPVRGQNSKFNGGQRCTRISVIFELKKLSTEDIRTLLLRAVNDTEKGMGSLRNTDFPLWLRSE